LDERFAQGRDMLGRNFAAGRDKASSVFNKLYSDVEYLRESQRRRGEDARGGQSKRASQLDEKAGAAAGQGQYPIDVSKAQQSVQAAGVKAGAFISSWTTWAGEKRKTGGWGAGWGKKSSGTTSSSRRSEEIAEPASPIDKDYQFVSAPGSAPSEPEKSDGRPVSTSSGRPISGASSTIHVVPATPAVKTADEPPQSPDDGFTTEDLVGSGSKDKNEAKTLPPKEDAAETAVTSESTPPPPPPPPAPPQP
jgi:hypothetical protein